MNPLRQARFFAAGANVMRIGLGLVLCPILMASALSAQDVPVVVSGVVSLTGGGPIYNGQYVLKQTDFGFLWLNTSTLAVGHIQVLAKCGMPPTPWTGLYVNGDCWGIQLIHTSGAVVMAGYTSSCFLTSDCSGNKDKRVPLQTRFTFALGTWQYLGDGGEIPDSIQTKDLAGRTWTVAPTPGSTDFKHYTWHASGDPNAPPAAGASATNTSAAARSDKANYFGDQWSLTDTSSSIAAITSAQWDLLYNGTFTADAAGGTTPGQTFTYPFPCDPSAGGTLTSPYTGCWASLGATPPPTYRFALTADNGKPGSPTTFVSSAFSVAAPKIGINGTLSTGSTLNINVLTGGNADASTAATGGTQGNPSTFAWTFTPGGSASGPVVAVPAAATTFSLTVTYPGGYSTSVSGSVHQTDLVPAFSLSPSTVLINANLTLTNQMQKSAAATLNSVGYSINTTSATTGTLASSFNPSGGAAMVAAPGSAGSFTITLTYNFTDHLGAAQSLAVSKPFSTTIWAPSPSVGVYMDTGKAQPAPYFGGFVLTAGTTYYVFDDESGKPLPVGMTHPGSGFFKSTNSSASVSGDTSLGTSTGAGPVSFVPAACASSCFLKAQVPASVGAVGVVGYTASSSGGGNPGGGTPTLTLSGPSTGTTGTPVTFSANDSNFTGTVVYTWNWGDGATSGGGGGGGSLCPPGVVYGGCGTTTAPTTVVKAAAAQAQSHTYASPGTYTVSVSASASGATRTALQSISIVKAGPPAPSTGYTVTGATANAYNGVWEIEAGRTLTLSATEPDPLVTFVWNFGDGTTGSGQTVDHVYPSVGAKTIVLTATAPTGDTVTSGSSTGQIRVGVLVPKFRAIMIPSAGSIASASGAWATDISVTNPGTRPTTVTLYFAAFTDTIPTDLSLLPFDSRNSFPLGPGESWSGVDVVGSSTILNRPGAGKGMLLLKYDGGDQPPMATARVYFTADGSSFGTALPTFTVGPYGPLESQAAQLSTDQILIGLRNDSSYRFNISLFNAASQSGLFHVDAFTEDGAQVASQDFGVPPYGQAGFNDTYLFTPDPAKRYVLKARVVGSTGALRAFASQLDRRTSDVVQVSDDTPRIAAAPDETITYYVAGVGRIESSAHWRTDLRFYNASSLPRTLTLEYRYTPPGGTADKFVFAPLTIGAGQGVSLDDIVGNFLDDYTPDDLKTGSSLGLLKISYPAPADIATAPLIIGGRNYADRPTGTAGMQLSTYTAAQNVAPGAGALVMPGAQQNLRFRTNVGIFTMGDLPTRARISAIRQNGTVAGVFEYVLNDPDKTGAFVQVPLVAVPNIDGNPMTIKVESVSGSPVGAYIATVDQISADTVFIQGKPVR